MPSNDGVEFKPSSIKTPLSSPSSISIKNPNFSFFNPPFACQSPNISSEKPNFSITHFLNSLKLPQNVIKFPFFSKTQLPGSSELSVSQPSESRVIQLKEEVSRVSSEGDERVLIKEVLVRGKDGTELEKKELELEVLMALKASQPNSVLSVKDVQEDVHRVIDSGSFTSCRPVVVDSKDGTKLVFEVEPNQELRGLVCEGANVLPSKFIKDSFQDGYGKVVNVKRLGGVIDSINGWYMERGLFGMVSGVEILSDGVLKLEVSEAEVNDISIRFLDKDMHEKPVGKTKPETILRELSTKKGQIYSINQGKRDVETVLAMGIMDDIGIIPQPSGDTGKVDLVMNVVERVSGGFSAGGGLSSGITNGLLSGFIGSLSYCHKNLFGKNQKVNVSLERGQIDSIFRIAYQVPWIDGDNKRTRSSIMVQNSRNPGTLVHGDQPDGNSLTIDRVTAGVEVSRPLRPKWNGTAGLTFQHAGARDHRGNPLSKDCYGSPLSASGNFHDNMLLSKCELSYTGESGSSMFVFSMEQGLPILPEWLRFNRINSRSQKRVKVGLANILLSLSGGHVVGSFSPHEAFAIGGTDSVRGYEEGAVGSGRSYVVGCGEISFPLFGPVDGALFADYGSDLRSGPSVLGDPAGARLKPGSGYGYGCGIRFDSPLGPLRLEYALNDKQGGRFHFGVGYRN
ncbi:outer envelope protein 80, chloroplastic-like isoform X1 [Silene latifolia]|uniref:outer envelope protein 80, chloroplastic-like isoform X1 n=2 Tax=Silene latifolia TaxID=37657 RepID=UPI003D76FCAE